jgi:ABC-type branched-subunit amino acid transport system ATPase component
MQIRQVQIEHFRGIQSLTWKPPGKISCLIGPGDSRKTTILDAIQLALTPRYDPQLSDVDFHGLDTMKPVEITVTIGALPDALQLVDALGLHLRGWHPESGLQDEPGDDLEGVLSVRFTINEHLEPKWVAWTARADERERPIGPGERQSLGCARIGANVAWDLTWSQRSALSRAAGPAREAEPYLAGALRLARQSMTNAELPTLHAVATEVEELAKHLGVKPGHGYRPGLSPLSISLRHGAISLHDGLVPLSGAGLGTQRLTAIAVQKLSIREGAILLLDEVEHGLEPHRLRHLLRLLRDDPGIGQVLLTSHSPIAIEELEAGELSVVRRGDVGVQVRHVGAELQATVRSAAEALLSMSVLVCEGKTELGLCRTWDRAIWQKGGSPALAQAGTYPIDGRGHAATQRALDLTALGYRVALFRDGDVPLPPEKRAELTANDVTIVEWTDGLNTEERICGDLPLPHLQKLVDAACEDRSGRSIADAIATALGDGGRQRTSDLATLLSAGVTEADVRRAVGRAAHVGSWFRQIHSAEKLGVIVADALPEIPTSNLAVTIARLRTWAHG